jgi:inositol 1,4,5-triphosphate receptor type 3
MTCTDTFTLYYLFYTIIAFISFKYENALHPFLLLDIIVKNSTTADVVKAVVYPAKQLSAAALLGVFVIYIFAMITFKNFASDFRYDGGDDVYGKPGFDDFMSQEDAEHLNEDCRTLWGCFKVSLNYGMRLSGGTGDIMQHTLEGKRLLLDLFYFLVVLVVLLNVIFGIIIDTFSELRQEKMDKLKDKIGFCFICGIPSSTFEQASSEPAPFKRHIKNDHYMWNYLNFIIFVWEQDKDDDDGLELYVRKLLEKEEITWFPVGSALCLSATDTKEESTAEHIDRVSSGLRVAVDDANEKQLKTIGEVNVSLNGTVQKIHEMLVKAENEKKPVKSEGQRADEGAAALIKDSKRNR